MNDRVTIDTNVLIYAFGKQEDQRKKVAVDIIESCDILSLQALNEATYVLRKKFNFPYNEIEKIIEFLRFHFVISDLTIKTLDNTIAISNKYTFSFWDSMMIASALDNNCSILYSEDLHHDQVIEGRLKIRNPFIDLSGLR